MAAYGLVLTDPLPMVGTYHRAGVSRWVLPLKPLTELVGCRMEVRVAVSDAARETGEHSGGGRFEVLFNGVDMGRFESAVPVRADHEPPRPTVLFVGRH
jgi:phosphatidylinositol alpha-mannosyltransferase